MKKITTRNIAGFKNYLTEEEKSDATIEKYLRDIKAFTEWLGGRQVDKKTVLEYKAYLVENYMPASVNSVLSSLNSFFECNEWYDCKVKLLKIQKQLFSSAEKELTKAEYKRLLCASRRNGDERLYLLMQTICACGIRVSELRYITVENLRREKAHINMKGKMRVVIIPKKLCGMLLKFARKEKISSGSVFISKNGNPLDRSNIWKMMKSLCKTANVAEKKVFPHNLRHLFARTFYSLRKDVFRLADILGHSSINTTRIYTMETGDVHCKQIQELGLLVC